jgi:hypothetical protein
MRALRFSVAVVAGAATLAAGGVLIYGVLFPTYFPDVLRAGTAIGVPREAIDTRALTIGLLAYSGLLTVVIGMAGIRTPVGGAALATVVSALQWFSADFLLVAVTHVGTAADIAVDPLLKAVPAAVAGAVIAAILSKAALPARTLARAATRLG